MSVRYLALVHTPDRAGPAVPEAAAAMLQQAGWRGAAEDDGLSLWTRSGGARVLKFPCGGLVVGDVWSLGGAPLQPSAWPTSLDRPLAAQQLVENAWGTYVAFLRSAGHRDWTVLRSPAAGPQVLSWKAGGATILAADLDDLPRALAPDRRIDRRRLADYLRRPDLASAWTPLATVSTLAPGEAMRLDARRPSRVLAWTPAMAARGRRPATRDEAADRLRRAVVIACSTGMTEGRGLLELSGGLDSGIVAAAMAAGGAAEAVVTAVNFYSDRTEGDERRWAAAVAAHAGLPFQLRPKAVTPLRPQDFEELAAGAFPAIDTLDADRDREIARLAAATEVDWIATGQGGDAVFFQMASAPMLREALQAGGAPSALLRLWLDLARRRRSSVWPVLGNALRPRVPTFETFMPVAEIGSPPPHPWMSDVEGLGEATRGQIRGLVAMQAKFGPTRRAAAAAVRHPLLAQPVVEASLVAPSWWHVAGGRDRALARDAFAGDLPPGLARRLSKGAMSSHYARRMALSLDWLRPYLMEGWLAGQGLLDAELVGRVLTPEDLLWRARGLALLRVAAVEAWARHWG